MSAKAIRPASEPAMTTATRRRVRGLAGLYGVSIPNIVTGERRIH
jgi:hypothetical protein